MFMLKKEFRNNITKELSWIEILPEKYNDTERDTVRVGFLSVSLSIEIVIENKYSLFP